MMMNTMMNALPGFKTCPHHNYYQYADSNPVCPLCEAERHNNDKTYQTFEEYWAKTWIPSGLPAVFDLAMKELAKAAWNASHNNEVLRLQEIGNVFEQVLGDDRDSKILVSMIAEGITTSLDAYVEAAITNSNAFPKRY